MAALIMLVKSLTFSLNVTLLHTFLSGLQPVTHSLLRPLCLQVYVSYDYGTTFTLVSEKFKLAKDDNKQVISQFYHSPADNRRVSVRRRWSPAGGFSVASRCLKQMMVTSLRQWGSALLVKMRWCPQSRSFSYRLHALWTCLTAGTVFHQNGLEKSRIWLETMSPLVSRIFSLVMWGRVSVSKKTNTSWPSFCSVLDCCSVSSTV